MKTSSFILIVGLFVFSSCSRHIYVNYQPDSANTGKVVIKPTKPTSRTYVTVNDNLLVDRKYAKSVTINNIPDGEYILHYTSDNTWYKDKMDVKIPLKLEDEKIITKLVEVPPYSTGYWIYSAALVIIMLGGGIFIY